MLIQKNDIKQWLKEHKIENYEIVEHKGLNKVVCYGDVNLIHHNISILKVQFLEVKGNFLLSNNHLNTLKGSPEIVGGIYNISQNEIKTLLHSPKTVHKHFICCYNDLHSLNHISPYIGQYLNCEHNPIEDWSILPDFFSEIIFHKHFYTRQDFVDKIKANQKKNDYLITSRGIYNKEKQIIM